MKKILYLIMIICLLTVTGCACSRLAKEKKQEDEYKNQAKTEAIKYINNKYGISLNDDNIKNVYLEQRFVNEFDHDSTGNATITAIYNNKEFKIYVNCFKKNIEDYTDDYEKDIVFESIQNYYYEKIGLDANNTKLLLNFGLEMHDKFIDVNTLFSNMKSDKSRFIVIITTGKVNSDDVEKTAKEYDIFNLYIYKLNDGDNLNGFRDDIEFTKDYSFYENKLFSDHSRLYIEDVYQYEIGGYYNHIKYTLVSLDNGIYVRSEKENNISIKKIKDKEIKQYQDKINTCGNDLNVLGVYKVSTTISEKKYLINGYYIYNMNKVSNDNFNKYDVYPIIINYDTDCHNNYNESFILLNSSTSYIAVVSTK